ncbi:unnamed protein product [Arabis nemorensis]|uniref:Uncharacterized protein n=1 Tax=Arabis nemorensis TaxID=586526 RepID=A0A565C8L1_9BRAS|nr:unnamed protein product [Arabis nemorensis]
MDQATKAKEIRPVELPALPNRMFAVGHGLVGIQVTAYHPFDGIRVILNALEEEEVVYLRTVFVILASCSELT